MVSYRIIEEKKRLLENSFNSIGTLKSVKDLNKTTKINILKPKRKIIFCFKLWIR